MAIGQRLRGPVGQGMNGRRPNFIGALQQYPPGSYTFTATQTGRWKFVAWANGGGGGGSQPNASGAGGYAEITRVLLKGQTVPVTVGSGGNGIGGNTSLTFPDGTVVICTPGIGAQFGGAGGTATGGDVNIVGGAGGSPFGGSAAGILPFRGGAGGTINVPGQSPGGGGGQTGSGNAALGGDGMVLAFFVKL